MTIGIDASRANRGHKSGTEWYSYYLIRNLAKIDSKNNYILYTDKPLTAGLTDLTTEDSYLNSNNDKPQFDIDGYQIIKSPHNNFKAKILSWPFYNFWTLIRFSLEMIFKRPDVLFVPAHGIPLIRPKKTINTIHDIAFKVDNRIYGKERIGSDTKHVKKIVNLLVRIFTLGEYGANAFDYLDWSSKLAISKLDKVITVSNFSKEEIKRIYKATDDKIEVVHNGYNDSLYKEIDNQEKELEVLNKYGIVKPYILNVGRLERKKNTTLLIEGFAGAKRLNKNIKEKLVLVGDASFGYDEVKYLIKELGVDDDVILPGWIEEEDMPYIFNGATAFIFPSKHEGFGIPVLQSMACGVPVACSDIPPLREVASDAALFFDLKQPNSIAHSIEMIINNDDLRNSLKGKGLRRAENFSWQKCAQETLGIINGLENSKK